MATRSSVFVGIDISMNSLEVAFFGDENILSFVNSQKGISPLIDLLQEKMPVLVVVEATGGYEKILVQALNQEAIPVSIVLPKRIRDFARAQGILAKTDRLDAKNIASFASSLQPRPNAPLSADQVRLSALVDRRRQIALMLKAERTRLHKAPPDIRPCIDEHIEWLLDEEKRLEALNLGFDAKPAGNEEKIRYRPVSQRDRPGHRFRPGGGVTRIRAIGPEKDRRAGWCSSLEQR